MAQIIATKRAMTQVWTKSGKRLPVTVLNVKRNVLLQAKEDGKALVGYGERRLKNTPKPLMGTLKKANVKQGVYRVRQVDTDVQGKTPGAEIKASELFQVGNIVDVTGTSKGLGFAGVVKLFKFKGGPRTHGQSDRLRAPGSIGAGTTPGRVYKNKRMSGRGGNKTVTVENLRVIAINDEIGELTVSGLVPGSMNSMVIVTKVADGETFEGLFTKEDTKKQKKLEVMEEVKETPEAEQAQAPEAPAPEPDVKKEPKKPGNGKEKEGKKA